MDLQLREKIAVVTGGSGGIGSAICKTLAREGAGVVVAYLRNSEAAKETVRQIGEAGGSAVAFRADVREADSVRSLFEAARDRFDGIDVLINCAGVAHFESLARYSEVDWDRVIDTNLKGVFQCCKAVVPYFVARGGGDIVNISSLAASTGSFEGGAYAASKSAVNILTLSFALELAASNIRVNAVAPGRIDTSFRRTREGPYFDFMLQQTPQKRMGTPQEVAEAVTFMASRACSFVTGEVLSATGGLHSVYLHHVVPDPNGQPRHVSDLDLDDHR